MVKCSECNFLRCERGTIPNRFVSVSDPGFGTVMMGGAFICQHPACFVYDGKVSPERGGFLVKSRIRGQAQLNKNNDCPFFKKQTTFLTWLVEYFNG